MKKEKLIEKFLSERYSDISWVKITYEFDNRIHCKVFTDDDILPYSTRINKNDLNKYLRKTKIKKILI